jgi:hypothetical protein
MVGNGGNGLIWEVYIGRIRKGKREGEGWVSWSGEGRQFFRNVKGDCVILVRDIMVEDDCICIHGHWFILLF